MSDFQPGEQVVVYLPEPFRRTPPTGVVQGVAYYAASSEPYYDILMDDGKYPQVITVREHFIEAYGVFEVAAQEAAHNG